VRYAHIAEEIDNRKLDLKDIGEGIFRFCIGLFKKVCIANIAGELVKTYIDSNLATLSISEAWFGIMMFSIQIYFDFSGYSNMAIGLGKMFGFHYSENFHYPYTAKSATDFWWRWHISLGTFFRD
jgi:alginate O-acetyltransferase complex protein AlgI